MIVKKELLARLRRIFDLNLYEVKIWSALLSRGVSTAGELSDIANVPRSRSYDILESLEKKGFAIAKIGKPIKYIAIPPEEVVERVKKRMKQEVDEKVNNIENLKQGDLISELKKLHSEGIELVEPSDMSGSLKGRHNLYNHIEMTIRNAEDEVLIIATEKELIRKTEALKETFEKICKRGVKIKIATNITNETRKAAEEISQYAEVREIKDIKARVIVVDGKEIIFMIMPDDIVHPTYDVGLWVNTPFFAKAFADLFNLAWKDMKPFAQPKKVQAKKSKA